ncbi:methylated-DNA--[protein]-cysteine S-methyltransferase [Roseovarius salis]|uniref:methylated-DNA--[protein]-cysteine S-methyltransferase n=1 Tax=Roseovarius salis TaxID=3376063 RepID=UPI0037C975BE
MTSGYSEYAVTIDSPLGALTVVSDGSAITAVRWGAAAGAAHERPELDEAAAQLGAYFDGQLASFDLPLRVSGSEFQRSVCVAMRAIPFGRTCRYGDLAARLEVSPQAVGAACGANPIPIVIPCHRVLGAHGLGGFSAPGGVETKVWLLRHEGAAGLLI